MSGLRSTWYSNSCSMSMANLPLNGGLVEAMVVVGRQDAGLRGLKAMWLPTLIDAQGAESPALC